MSQHDFNIANQTFPSFRSDLNDALQAAATMSAGASAPTTPYAYQLWFDTTTDTWKVRNSGNTAWISTITTDLATGNVLIGDSAPQVVSKLTVSGNGSADTGTFMYDGSAGTYFDINTNAANGTVDLEANARTGAFPPLTFKTGGSEAGRWDANGNLLVGTTSTSLVTTSTETGAQIYDGGFVAAANDPVAYFNRITSDGSIAQFRKDGTLVGSIGVDNTDNLTISGNSSHCGLNFSSDDVNPYKNGAYTDGTTSLGSSSTRFNNLYLSGGVYLGGTGSANLLDDYEIGNWNPTFVSSNGGESVTYDVQKGGYIKVGRLVHIQIQLGTTSVSGGSGYIQIGNLPFVNDGGTNGASAIPIDLAYSFASTITGGSSAQVGTTKLHFYKNDNAANVWSWTALATGSGSNRVWMSGTYITS